MCKFGGASSHRGGILTVLVAFLYSRHDFQIAVQYNVSLCVVCGIPFLRAFSISASDFGNANREVRVGGGVGKVGEERESERVWLVPVPVLGSRGVWSITELDS